MHESDTPGAAATSRLGRTIAKNAVFVTLGDIALKAINFAFAVYIVRQLGDNRFGQYSIVLAYPGLFQIFAEFGMTQYVMREVARDRSKAQHYFWNLVVLRLILASISIAGITVSAALAGYDPDLVFGIFLNTCTFLLAAFAVPLETILKANERLDYVSAIAVVGRLAFIVVCTLFLLSGGSYILLVLAGLLTYPLTIGMYLWAVRRHKLAPLTFQIDPRIWLHLIRAGLPFGVIMLTLTISFSIDTVMLGMFEPNHVVGWYNAAYNLIPPLMLAYGGFSAAIVPSLARAYVQDKREVERWYHRSVKFILILSLPLAVGGMLVAYPMILFLYDKPYLPSGLGLQILIWDIPFLMFSSFCGNMTTIIGEEKAAARIYTINALANIILNLYAIPRFGMIGAALVTVVTDMIGALQFHFLLRDKLHLPDMTWVWARAVLAATVMGVTVLLVGSVNFFIQIAVGAVVYGALVLVLRLIDQSEWSAIRRLLSRRRAPRPTDQPAGS